MIVELIQKGLVSSGDSDESSSRNTHEIEVTWHSKHRFQTKLLEPGEQVVSDRCSRHAVEVVERCSRGEERGREGRVRYEARTDFHRCADLAAQLNNSLTSHALVPPPTEATGAGSTTLGRRTFFRPECPGPSPARVPGLYNQSAYGWQQVTTKVHYGTNLAGSTTSCASSCPAINLRFALSVTGLPEVDNRVQCVPPACGVVNV